MATNKLDPNETMDHNMKKWLTEQPLEIKIEPGEGDEEDRDTMQDEMVEQASHEAEETSAQNKLFTCKVCNKNFMHASSLHRHQKYHHPLYHEGKPFACKLCPCAFKAKGYLQRHMEKHRNAGASTDIKAESSLICPLCPKVYDTSRNLQLHIATHVGELSPFKLNDVPVYATIVKKPVTPVVMLPGSVGTTSAQTSTGQEVVVPMPAQATSTIVKEPVTPQTSAGQQVALMPEHTTIVKKPVTPVVLLAGPGSVGTVAKTSVGQRVALLPGYSSGAQTSVGHRVALIPAHTSGVSETGAGHVAVKAELCQPDSPRVYHSGKKVKLCQSPRSKHNGRKSEVCESKRVKIVHKSEHSRVGIDTKVDKEAIDNILTSKDTAELPRAIMVHSSSAGKEHMSLQSGKISQSEFENTSGETGTAMNKPVTENPPQGHSGEMGTAMHKPVTEKLPSGLNGMNNKLVTEAAPGHSGEMGTSMHKLVTENSPEHSRETKPKCHICGRQFAVEKHLQVHMKTHNHKEKIPCPFCDRTFQQTRHLQIHIRAHTGEKPFQCNLCPKSFISKHLLSKHVKYHTQSCSEDVGEIDYRCAVCGKAYSSASGLHRHKQQAHPSGF